MSKRMGTDKQKKVYEMLESLGIELNHIGYYTVEAYYDAPFGQFELSLPEVAFENMSNLLCSICSKVAHESKVKARQEFQNELKSLLGIEQGE